MRKIRVSASRLSNLWQCSYSFYLQEILLINSLTHPKTRVGSAVHSILEALCKPRRKWLYDLIVDEKKKTVDYRKSPLLVRFVETYKRKFNLESSLLDSMNDMLKVALLDLDFFFKDAQKVFPPETEFKFQVGDATLKGFFDRLAEYPDRFIIRDYKSKGSKFTQSELPHNIQALIYQYAVNVQYGKPAEVEFVLLRFAPTTRTPEKHLQKVPPATSDQFRGLEIYIEYIDSKINHFTLQDAYSSPCADAGFCKNVCSFKKPFNYYAIIEKQTGEVVRTERNLDTQPKFNETTEYAELREYKGCPVAPSSD